ncbi:MAG TPA: secondary thiamine-phosphate synthase enzyme YjbQ [Candidatus Polarisedimenticolia bacterium]|nr:secondary thiamine-phosphate synthase enzyme YjbQ [Candidatus Polarisedimenticolia bacterium]
MRIYHGSSEVRTSGKVTVENVTDPVARLLGASGIAAGMALISVPHTTCGLAVNEDEEGLKEDIRRLAAGLLSPLAREARFRHDCVDDNAQAHLTSILLGHSISLPVAEGALCLGTWQSLFLIEMDGPRARRLNVQILGE